MSETQLQEFLDSESSFLLTNLAFTALMTGFTILLIYDDVYPTFLTGKKSDGSVVQFNLCPEDNDFIQLSFVEDQVQWMSNSLISSIFLSIDTGTTS